MHCLKCHSPRIIRFLDGFGQWRVFCRSCQESVLLLGIKNIKNVKKLWEFTDHYKIQSIKLNTQIR